ncbi:MAG: hypothetical protein Q9187_001788, partial [Circinaria calcarea]
MTYSRPSTFQQSDGSPAEDIVGEMSIEAYIDRLDSFRSSSAPFHYPLPLMAELLDTETYEHWNAVGVPLRPKITEILKSYDVQHTRWWLRVYNFSKPGYPNGVLKMPTVRVELEGSKGRNFGVARDAILHLLRQHGLSEFHVELIDLERCFEPSLFPLGPERASVKSYNAIRDELAALISLRLKLRWSAMCIFLVGKTENLARPTIVVMVIPLTTYNWNNLTAEVNEVIRPKMPPGESLGIGFLPGDRGLLTGEREEHHGKSFAYEDFKYLSPDSSMGIRNGIGGGTVGGFVDLTCNGVTRRGILTNYHVVAPLESAPAQVRRQADRYGSSLFRQDPTRTTAIFMALPDIAATRKHLEETASILMIKSEEIREEQRLRIAAGARPLEMHEIQLRNRGTELYQRTSKLKALEKMPYMVGNLLVSSGKLMISPRVDRSIFLDWAFIELSADIPLQQRRNELPKKKSAGLHGKNPQAYGIDETYVGDAATCPILGFSKIEPGEWYFKNGRTTGITTGICHGIELYTPRSGNDLVRYDTEGKEVKVTNGIMKEWVILNRRLHGTSTQNEFCMQGDSGAFVINSRGEVAGLLYGYLHGFCGPPSEDSEE